jgi:hypothetical protein
MHHASADSQAGKSLEECGLPDAIVDCLDTLGVCETIDFGSEIVLRCMSAQMGHTDKHIGAHLFVQDDMVTSGTASNFGLGLGGDSADDTSAQVLGELHDKSSSSASCSVHEYRIAGLDWIRVPDEILRGESLKEGSAGCVERKLLHTYGRESV